jgi:GH18 family chitinase
MKSRKLLTLALLFVSAFVAAAQTTAPSYWSSGYFPSIDGSMTPSQIPFSSLTHVIHWNVAPMSDGSLNWADTNMTAAQSANLVAAAHGGGVKALVSISNQWPTTSDFNGATSSANMQKFVSNIVTFVQTRGYDGVDIDWEPLNNSDLAQWSNLIVALRQAFDQITPRPLLTAAVWHQEAATAAVQANLDQINVMTYDMAGIWSGQTWHHAALYGAGGALGGLDTRMTGFLNAGVSAAKLGIGIPFYGYVWQGGCCESTGGVTLPKETWSTPPGLSQMTYSRIMGSLYQSQYDQWDSGAQVPYLAIDNTGSSSDKFVSYDNTKSITAKINYLKSKGFGGVMVWHMSMDFMPSQAASQQHPLASAIQSALFSGGTSQAQVAKPVISPAGGAFVNAAAVTLTTSTSGASIHYTLDGTDPTSSSALYTAPLSLTSSATLKAKSFASGMTASTTASAIFTIQAATPVINPAGGSFATSTSVTLSTSTPNAAIRYTLDGSNPTSSSTGYSAPLTINASRTVKAATFAAGMATSAIASVAFTIQAQVATPVITPAGGTFTGPAAVAITTATAGATIRYTVNGTTPTSTSPLYSGPLSITASATLKATASATGMTDSNVASATFTINAAPPTQSPATAAFVRADTATQGSWKSSYGTDGYGIVNDATAYPAYATAMPAGQAAYTWSASTTDVKALQKASLSDRIAATWFAGSSFSINVAISDQKSHQVAIYCLDWDNKARSQRIDILDPKNAVLDTRTISSFSNGTYLVWNVTGQVKIQVTTLAGPNAVVSGIFFGGPTPTSATFLKSDATTQGNWQGVYGADGYNVIDTAAASPAYVMPGASGQTSYVWETLTNDPRALRTPGTNNRTATTWYSGTSFSIDLNFADGKTHQFALYCLDWDSSARAQTVQILDANNKVLDTRTLSSFNNGLYLVWNLSGHVTVRVTQTAGANAVVSGLFFR